MEVFMETEELWNLIKEVFMASQHKSEHHILKDVSLELDSQGVLILTTRKNFYSVTLYKNFIKEIASDILDKEIQIVIRVPPEYEEENIFKKAKEEVEKIKKAGTEEFNILLCKECNGSGNIIDGQKATPLGRINTRKQCSTCDGLGVDLKQPFKILGEKVNALSKQNIDLKSINQNLHQLNQKTANLEILTENITQLNQKIIDLERDIEKKINNKDVRNLNKFLKWFFYAGHLDEHITSV